MDPEQLAAVIAAGGALLAALGVRQRRTTPNLGETPTTGLAVARRGAGAARVAGNLTGATGRLAAGTAAAVIRAGGATVAHAAGLAVDGVPGLGRAGRSLFRRETREPAVTRAAVGRSRPAVEAPRAVPRGRTATGSASLAGTGTAAKAPPRGRAKRSAGGSGPSAGRS